MSRSSTPPRCFTESDVVSVHTPLTAENLHLIDTAAAGADEADRRLINTARGGVVDEVL